MRALNADEAQLVASYRAASRAAVRYAVFAQAVRSRLHLYGVILDAIDTMNARAAEDDEFAAQLLTEIAKHRRVRGSSAALAEVFETIRAHAEQAVFEGVQP
jgi:predicted ATP-dependent protease